MWWLIAVIVVIAAFAFPKFGKTLLLIVGLVALAIWVMLENDKRETRAAKSRVSAAEVGFDALELVPGYSSNGSYQLKGRLRNHSQRYTLTSVELRVKMDDCQKPLSPDQLSEIERLEGRPGRLSFDERQTLAELIRRRESQSTPNWRPGCETVGESVELVFLSVPPGQSRDLDEYVRFSNLGRPRGEFTWSYDLVSVSGR